jgi:hypothetical protein
VSWDEAEEALAHLRREVRGRYMLTGGRIRVYAPWRVVWDVDRLLRATWLWEHGRRADAMALYEDLKCVPIEPRFSKGWSR